MGTFRPEERKCGTCRFYNCSKKVESSFLTGKQISVNYKATCICPKSSRKGKEIYDTGSCSYWDRDPVAEELVFKTEQQREKKRLEQEKAREKERQEAEEYRRQYELEREKRRQKEKLDAKQKELDYQQTMIRMEQMRLEQERKQLEYEKWYSKLTPEEQAKEDERLRLEKIEREKQAEESRKKQEKEERKRRIRSEEEQERLAEERRLEQIEKEKQQSIIIKKRRIKRIFLSVVLLVLITLVVSCSVDRCNRKKEIYSQYDKVVGIGLDLVTVNFVYGNIEGKKGDVYMKYGVQKGIRLNKDDLPSPPTNIYFDDGTSKRFDFDKTLTKYDGYTSYEELNYNKTIYVYYYERQIDMIFNIVIGDNVRNMFTLSSIKGNEIIKSFPTLNDDYFITESNIFQISRSIGYYMDKYGASEIVGWYYDYECTKPITFPMRAYNYNDSHNYYLKCK